MNKRAKNRGRVSSRGRAFSRAPRHGVPRGGVSAPRGSSASRSGGARPRAHPPSTRLRRVELTLGVCLAEVEVGACVRTGHDENGKTRAGRAGRAASSRTLGLCGRQNEVSVADRKQTYACSGRDIQLGRSCWLESPSTAQSLGIYVHSQLAVSIDRLAFSNVLKARRSMDVLCQEPVIGHPGYHLIHQPDLMPKKLH